MTATTSQTSNNTHKQIWLLAWPIMLSNISVPLLGLVDTAILGHLDNPNHLAAVAMGASLFTFVLWSFGFLRMGTTALIAQQFGKQGNSEQSSAFTAILQSSMLLGVSIGVVILLVSPLLISFMVWVVDAVDSVSPLAQTYLQIRFMSAPATLMNYALLGLFIGLGNTRVPLILLVSANSLNAILNYCFVYIWHMGSAGVAYASVIVEYLQLFAAVAFAYSYLFKALPFSNLKQYWPELLQLNLNLFIRTLLLLFTLAFFMSRGAQHSAALLSANAILLNLLLFISNALDGFAVAAESLVGRACGKRDPKQVWQVVKDSGKWSLATAVLFSAILFAFNQPILWLLTSQAPVIELLTVLEPWLICLPLAGFASYWLDGVFVGLADGRTMRNSLVFAVLFIYLPLWYVFQSWPYHGLWVAFYGFLLARAFWLLIKLRPAINKSRYF